MKSCFIRIVLLLFLVFSGSKIQAQQKPESLYPKKYTEKSGFYNFLWGKHYRELYSLEIPVVEIPENEHYHFFPVIEGYPYFRTFPKFKELYEKEDFKDTYTERFVADAYTISHPLAFVITDGLARNIGLNIEDNQLFYRDTIIYKSVNLKDEYFNTKEVISKLQEDFKYRINEKLYIRSRLLDMIIGNSLDVHTSYLWKTSDKDRNVFIPHVIDRGFSFPKKDGVLYDFLLKSLGVDTVENYYKKKIKPKKINSKNYATDVAFSGRIKEKDWFEEASFIKEILSKDVIEGIFEELPDNFRDTKTNTQLKEVLIYKIANIEILAKDYYTELQKTVLIQGTSQDDTFIVVQNENSTSITLKNSNEEVVIKNEFLTGYTREIWLYGFGGIDTFSISASEKNNTIIRIISNDNFNEYNLNKTSKNIKIYTPEQAIITDNEVGKAKLHKLNDPFILEYNIERPKHSTIAFQPGVLFDTDQSVRLGGKFIFTQYKFNHQPFSAKHELSWNHYYSLLYSGTFPTLNQQLTYTTNLWTTTSNHFQNFFGFGNESENHESYFGRDYNRVLLERNGFDVGAVYQRTATQKAVVKAGIERYNIIDEQKFNRDDIFQEGEIKGKTNFFINLNGNYQFSSEVTQNTKFTYLFVPEIGLMINPKDMNRNVPYLSGIFSLKYYPDLNRKYTIVSVLKAKTLFNESYEFYQAATMGGETGLRGFRNERFSGQQYFLHTNDFRINLGKLSNKLLPINYETFIGFDYGRVWYANEESKKWHASFGGGFSFRFINKFNTNISYFTSSERPRIILSLGYFF